MSGIRKTEDIVCPSCGTQGTVGLGMAMIDARSDYREFQCAGCRSRVPFQANRAIIDVAWLPPASGEEFTETPAPR